MGEITSRKPLLKYILWIIGIVFMAYVLLVSFLLFAPKMNSYFNEVSFESVKWKQHLADHDSIKQKMVKDLLTHHELVGMSQEDVDKLLGVPPATKYFKEFDYVYWLGPKRGGASVDSEWIGIKFEKGIVVQVEILTD